MVENSNFQEILLKVVKIILSFGKLDDDAWIIYHTYSTQLFLGAEIKICFNTKVFLPHGSDGKASACNVGDLGLILGLGSSPGQGNGNPLQCSCLENSMGRGAWCAIVHRVAKSQTWLSMLTPPPSHLIHKSTKGREFCFHLHFIDEETKNS